MQAPGTARDVSSLASFALGLACGVRLRLGWAYLSADARSHRQPYFPLPVRVLGAAFRLSAPHGCIVQLLHGRISCCSLTGQAVATYEAALECRSTPFAAIDVRVFATIRLLWRCFFHDPPTFRCSLLRGIGQLTTGLSWRWLFVAA